MKIHRLAVIAGLAAALMAAAPGMARGRVWGTATVTPNTGLVDGQTVQVSGSDYNRNQNIGIYECGGTTIPVTCTYFSNVVNVQADQDGAFGPVDFTVAVSFDGTQYVHGKPQPAHHDCLPANDCWIRAQPLSPKGHFVGAAFPSENPPITFATS